MKQRINRIFLLAAFTLSALCAHASKGSESIFDQANVASEQGELDQAIDLYQSILQEEQSANLHYNLANTYFKAGSYGPAILHYRKALVLDPSNPDYKANLRFAQEAAETTPSEPGLLVTYANILQVNTWAWLGTISFWTVIALMVLPRLYGWRGFLPWLATGGAVFIGLLCAFALLGYHQQGQEGVVLQDDSPLKMAPTESAPVASLIGQGEIAKIEEARANYFLISTADGQSKWIPKDHFAKIWD